MARWLAVCQDPVWKHILKSTSDAMCINMNYGLGAGFESTWPILTEMETADHGMAMK